MAPGRLFHLNMNPGQRDNCRQTKVEVFGLPWTLSLKGCWGGFAIFSLVALTAHKWACALCWLCIEKDKKLHTMCFIIRRQNASSWLVFSHSQTAGSLKVIWAPTAGPVAPTVRAPAIEPSWLYWIKHPVMYEAGAAPEGAELPHLLPPLCAYDLLSKLCSY